VARAPEAWTASPVSPGYGNPHDAAHAYQGVADNASYAPSAAYQAYPGADVSVGSGFASTSPATPYQSVGVGGTSPFAAPGYPSVGAGPAYPSVGAGPAYPGAATGYSAPGWSGYDSGPLTKPTNGLATAALVAGIVVITVLLFLGYAIVSAIAVILGVRALMKARAIKASGYPTAVGMGRAVTGLVLSGIGALLYVLSFVAA